MWRTSLYALVTPRPKARPGVLVRKEALLCLLSRIAVASTAIPSPFIRATSYDRFKGSGLDSSSKDVSSSLGKPLADPKLRALRMMATYLTDRDADLSSW